VKHNELSYTETIDGIAFEGTYEVENEEAEHGYRPTFTVCTLKVSGIDLMLVIDPRVVQEIEAKLLESWLWNT